MYIMWHCGIFVYPDTMETGSLRISELCCCQQCSRQAMYVLCNYEVRSCNHCWSRNAIIITYSERVWGLWYLPRNAHVILSSLATPDLLYFFHIISQRHDFQKFLNIKCAFWFLLQLLPETFLILRTEQDMIKNVYWSLHKVPNIVVWF